MDAKHQHPNRLISIIYSCDFIYFFDNFYGIMDAGEQPDALFAGETQPASSGDCVYSATYQSKYSCRVIQRYPHQPILFL